MCIFFKIEVNIAVPSKKAPLCYHVILVVQLVQLTYNKGKDDVQDIPASYAGR